MARRGNRNLRSPGGGDNLYLSSVVALKPETGELVWYYQTTPGDDWDYTATQHIVLADIMIDGAMRKVLMQAPKNGFFYVIDRTTGKLISAQPYTAITWAKGVDMATGRPIETPGVRYARNPSVQIPGPVGAHNWQPMAFNPQTGLVYIPVIDNSFIYAQNKPLQYKPGAWNVSDFAQLGQMILAGIAKGQMPAPAKGYIRAWDPVANKMVWQVEMTGGWNSGLLTTAGGLVFGGGSDGFFGAYDARTGARLWSIDLKTGMTAPPITYTVDGEQYVAIAAAFGGSGGLGATADPNTALQKYGNNEGRIFAFKIGGTKVVQPLPNETPANIPVPPAETVDPKLAAKGFTVFHQNCAVCHGVLMVSSGEVPDLRMVSPVDLGPVRPDRAGRRAGRRRHGLVQGHPERRRRESGPRLRAATGPGALRQQTSAGRAGCNAAGALRCAVFWRSALASSRFARRACSLPTGRSGCKRPICSRSRSPMSIRAGSLPCARMSATSRPLWPAPSRRSPTRRITERSWPTAWARRWSQ
ncbi:MAG: PQQ-binding-like beta-propeller repeat protein [Rhizomicrobium sp.]